MLMPLNGAAVHVAEQDPQAMHDFISGSDSQRLLYTFRSILSRSKVELLLSLNPKSAISQVVMDFYSGSPCLGKSLRDGLCSGACTSIEDAWLIG